MPWNSFSVICASVLSLVVWARLAPAQAASPAMSSKSAQDKCEGTEAPDADTPTSANPSLLVADGTCCNSFHERGSRSFDEQVNTHPFEKRGV